MIDNEHAPASVPPGRAALCHRLQPLPHVDHRSQALGAKRRRAKARTRVVGEVTAWRRDGKGLGQNLLVEPQILRHRRRQRRLLADGGTHRGRIGGIVLADAIGNGGGIRALAKTMS
jgi:hypothetical protein